MDGGEKLNIIIIQTLPSFLIGFCPRDAMIARVLAMALCLCLSVCLSQVVVLLKRLNESSCTTPCTINLA